LRLQQLKTDKESGALKLDSKQIEALSKLDEVKLQIASIEDLQKVNAKQMKDFKKFIFYLRIIFLGWLTFRMIRFGFKICKRVSDVSAFFSFPLSEEGETRACDWGLEENR